MIATLITITIILSLWILYLLPRNSALKKSLTLMNEAFDSVSNEFYLYILKNSEDALQTNHELIKLQETTVEVAKMIAEERTKTKLLVATVKKFILLYDEIGDAIGGRAGKDNLNDIRGKVTDLDETVKLNDDIGRQRQKELEDEIKKKGKKKKGPKKDINDYMQDFTKDDDLDQDFLDMFGA